MIDFASFEHNEEQTFPAQVKELDNIFAFLDKVMEEYSCSPKYILDIHLAVEEAFVNVASYSYPNKDGEAKIVISYDKVNNSLIFTLIDSGTAFDPLAKQEPDIFAELDDRPIGGLGIFLVKKLTNKVQYFYEDGKNYLVMEKVIG